MSEFVILSGARSAESKNLGRAAGQKQVVLFCCGAKILRQAQDDKSFVRTNHLLTPNSSLLTPNSFRQNDLRSPVSHRRWGERHEQILLFPVNLDFVRAEGEQEPVCADGAVWQEAKRPL